MVDPIHARLLQLSIDSHYQPLIIIQQRYELEELSIRLLNGKHNKPFIALTEVVDYSLTKPQILLKLPLNLQLSARI